MRRRDQYSPMSKDAATKNVVQRRGHWTLDMLARDRQQHRGRR